MALSGQPEARRAVLPPRLMIAAPQGRSGKTTVSVGLCAVFRQRGLAVQPFKKGPDYIDPSWLSAAAKSGCRNLDPFLTTEEKLLWSFGRSSQKADLALIEGAMGLYDGIESDGRGSSAHVARLVQAPVVLVVNVSRMTRSIAALVSGYQHFEPATNIAGVILNNVSGSRHESKLVAAVQHYCGIPVLGAVPRDPGLLIGERHLGLVPFRETGDAESMIDSVRGSMEKYLDAGGILTVAAAAGAMPATTSAEDAPSRDKVVKVGVVLDRVFTFYYPENLEALQSAGAEIVFIDSLRDQELPDIDALYIGGGFPEMFLEKLEANAGLRKDIARAAENGLPVYAECAGLMYLCQGIRWHGRRYEMAGVIPGEVEMDRRPQGHGYTIAEIAEENPLFPVGATVRGHEFHYSRLSGLDGVKFAYRVQRGHGVDGKVDGVVYKNVFAAYTHLHALGVPEWASSLVALASGQRKCQPLLSRLSN